MHCEECERRKRERERESLRHAMMLLALTLLNILVAEIQVLALSQFVFAFWVTSSSLWAPQAPFEKKENVNTS